VEVKLVKLTTGEEILTNVERVSGGFRLSKPMILIPHQQGLQMMPWLMFAAKDEIEIEDKNVFIMYEPKKELVNGYKQQTGGIVTAPANALNEKGKLKI
jgi:hypothetical protein